MKSCCSVGTLWRRCCKENVRIVPQLRQHCGGNVMRAKMLVVAPLIPVRGHISVADGVPVCGPNPREGIHKAVWSAAVHRRWFWRWRRYEKYDATVLVLHNPSGYLTKDSVGPAFT